MSESGELPLKRGTGLVATEMGATIVPVKILGTNTVLPCAKIIPRRRGMATVRFGKPMRFKKSDSAFEAMHAIEDALRAL